MIYRDWFRRALWLRNSRNRVERESLLLGRLTADGSPHLYPRSALVEHSTVEASSGAGKTSRLLAPMLEQYLSFGDCSAFVLDGKADSPELLCAAQAGAALGVGKEPNIPVKFFTPVIGNATYILNPFAQEAWQAMDFVQRADYLCAFLGLQYGRDYGASYFSDMSARSGAHGVGKYPHFKTIKQLNSYIRQEAVSKNKEEMPPEARRQASHLEAALYRLEHLEALNATAETHPAAAVASQINFMDLFLKPQVHVLHLPAAIGPEMSAMIGRMYLYGVLAAAAELGPRRRVPVLGIIDETARFVAKNLEYVLQTARSSSVALCLSFQSRKDLITTTSDLASVLDTNTRLRWWLAVSDIDVIKRLSDLSGTTIEPVRSRTKQYSCAQNFLGLDAFSITDQDTILPRLSVNELLTVSDDPDLAVMQVARGAGFAQYGGFCQIVRTDFHITEEEYQRRRTSPWPVATAETIVPRLPTPGSPSPAIPAPRPIVVESIPAPRKPKRKPSFPSSAGNQN